MATSEFAERLATNLRKPQGRISEIYGQRLTVITIDTEIQEVREVLKGLATISDKPVGAPWSFHWHDPNGKCSEACQRARKLYERLRIEGK